MHEKLIYVLDFSKFYNLFYKNMYKKILHIVFYGNNIKKRY